MSYTDAFLGLVLGSSCAGCNSPGRPWCRECAEHLSALVDPFLVQSEPPIAAACRYAAPVSGALVAFKEQGLTAAGPALAAALAAALQTVLPEDGPVALVPVPTRRRQARRRGMDHSVWLARTAAGLLARPGLEVVGLLAATPRADQAGLSWQARKANREGGFRVVAGSPSAVVLLDDIVTSGATMRACQQALTRSGHEVLAGAAVASAMSSPA